MVYSINKITIKNIKGKDDFICIFNGLCPNKVNIFVAPNGFGKSTITTAFKAASAGKMKLNKGDYYNGDEKNVPSLEINYTDGASKKTAVSDDNRGEVSKVFDIYVINSPLYAKATGKNMGGYATHSAELAIRDIFVCNIPPKVELKYDFRKIRSALGKSSPNLKSFFLSKRGLEFIVVNKQDIMKCCSQKRLSKIISETTSDSYDIDALRKHDVVQILLDKLVAELKLNEDDAVRYLIQIIFIVKDLGIDTVSNACKWIEYDELRNRLNNRLADFNTTGLNLKCSQNRGKLNITFGRADRMSNGERDVLSFVASLAVFESRQGTKPGILIIDEVFDYLDGANLMAMQYYLGRIIESVRDSEKIIFPIIMSHLDPEVFSNYNLKNMAVHYLTHKSSFKPDDKVIRLLCLRTEMKQKKEQNSESLEKYLLHYNTENWVIPDNILSRLPKGFWPDSQSFRGYLYDEVGKYISGSQDFNVMAVLLGLRIKVEEKTVDRIPAENRDEYYNQHGAGNKFAFAERKCELPEVFYLLQPLCNDSAHLTSGRDGENRNKVESSYLKIYSNQVREIIRRVFGEDTASETILGV